MGILQVHSVSIFLFGSYNSDRVIYIFNVFEKARENGADTSQMGSSKLVSK